MTEREQLQKAFAAFDAANQEDPNRDLIAGNLEPRELIYAHRMSALLNEFCPDASIPLQLAARSQHICRWKIPRADYPMDRPGYKRWRSDLAVFHGDTAAAILRDQGYDENVMSRVKDLLLKRGLKRDSEVQTLEDVICLVFIKYYLADFAIKHDEEKLLDIIRKTWNKMSADGHTAALALPLADHLLTLIGKALNPPTPTTLENPCI
jgi:hypothetical protein